MSKKLLFVILLITSVGLFSQENRKQIHGNVFADSIAVKDVHIFNKSSKKGTISNEYGEFQIPVKENDTLLISDIQYQSQQFIITKNHLNNLQIIIFLKPKINELNEVLVKKHNLSGILAIDAKNTIPLSRVTESVLDFSEVLLDIEDESNHTKDRETEAYKLTSPITPVGIDLMGIIINPLFKGVQKITSKKRYEKKLERQYLQDKKDGLTKIRNELGDAFFIKTLKIPANQIDAFLHYCKSQGIIVMYLSGKKIETIDILIKNSKVYLNQLKNEN